MHKYLLDSAYGWLLFGSTLHFLIDVVSQHLRGKRVPGAETTLYYGMHSAYALGQALFASAVLLSIGSGIPFFDQWQGWALGFVAAAAWSVICLAFIEYNEPRIVVGIFVALLLAAVLTK